MPEVDSAGPNADVDARGVSVGYSVGEGATRVSVGDMVGNVGVGPKAGAREAGMRVSDPLFDIGSAMGVSTLLRVGSMVGAMAASLVAIGPGVGVELR
jgi:hypothetical protein